MFFIPVFPKAELMWKLVGVVAIFIGLMLRERAASGFVPVEDVISNFDAPFLPSKL